MKKAKKKSENILRQMKMESWHSQIYWMYHKQVYEGGLHWYIIQEKYVSGPKMAEV